MKILQIAPAWISTPPQNYGGTELVISNLVKGLVANGEDVTLFATGDSKTSAKLKSIFDKGLVEQKLPWNGALPPFLHYFEAFKLAESGDFDIIHAHLSSGPDIMVLAFLANLKKPAILTIHSNWPFDKYTQMDRTFINLYARLIPTLSISKSHQKLHPQEFKHLDVLHNGLDLDDMQFEANPKEYLTWLGRIFPYKGLHDAIKAAKTTNNQLIFGGTIDEQKEDSFKYFNEQIKPQIDGKQIIYLGPLDLEQKNELLKNAKALLNPIDWEEPFGMVMTESMSCGTPVIAYNRGAAKEIIQNGKNGFLVDNLEQMIGAIEKISSIDRSYCRSYIDQNFSHKTIAKKAVKCYQQVIADRKSNSKADGIMNKEGMRDFMTIASDISSKKV